MILLIDNYDSFVHNLARYLVRLRQPTQVVRNDAITVPEIRALQPSAIVLSPGPCAPQQAGISLELIRELYQEIPILGICLGHQSIAEALGGKVVRGREPVHGRSSLVHHNQQGVFQDVPVPFNAGRYHSLVVDPDSLPRELEVTATTEENVIMGMTHREYPVIGLQFHPESILTQHGYQLLSNFLRLAGLDGGPAVLESAEYQPLQAEVPDGA